MRRRAFQPLGYRFEVASTMSVHDAKAAIRATKAGWFAAEGLPRGWLLGSFLCLWLSSFDEHGPMAFGRISQNGSGTKIIGRAGADLNGTALFILLTPLIAWLTWQMYQHGQGTTRAYVIIGVLFGLGLPLTLWINSKDRRQADPLVDFLSKAVEQRRSK